MSKFNLLSDSSLDFDGINDQMTNVAFFGGNLWSFQPDDPFTISLWVKIASIPSSGVNCILSRWSERGVISVGYSMEVEASGKIKFTLQLTDITAQLVRTSSALNTDQWYHITVSYDGLDASDGSGMMIYIDGVNDSVNQPGSAPIGGAIAYVGIAFKIGAINSGNTDPSGQTDFFEGRLHDLKQLNRHATDQDIADIYNSARSRSHLITGETSIGLAISFESFFDFFAIPIAHRYPDSGLEISGNPGFVSISGGNLNDVVKDAPEHAS